MLAALLDAETGQRGFLLTENGRYLEPYERAKVLLGGDIQRLKALVRRRYGRHAAAPRGWAS